MMRVMVTMVMMAVLVTAVVGMVIMMMMMMIQGASMNGVGCPSVYCCIHWLMNKAVSINGLAE